MDSRDYRPRRPYEHTVNEAKTIAADIISKGMNYQEVAAEYGYKLSSVQYLALVLRDEHPALFTKMRRAIDYRFAIKLANAILKNEIPRDEILKPNESFKRQMKRLSEYDKKLYLIVRTRIHNIKMEVKNPK